MQKTMAKYTKRRDKRGYEWKSAYREKEALMLERGYPEVSPHDFYRELFPAGSLQQEPEDGKGNIIATQIRPSGKGRTRQWVIDDSLKMLDKVIGGRFGLIPPISFYGKSHTKENAHELFAVVVDVDYVGKQQLKNLLKQFGNGVQLRPTYLVSSGKGVHLYYFLQEPVQLYRNREEVLAELKEAFIRRLWNDTSSIRPDSPDITGIYQGFRCVGSQSKLGVDFPVKAYKLSENRYTLEDIKASIPSCKVDLAPLYEKPRRKSTVTLMVGGYLKLMYPDGKFSKEELEEVLRISLEMRRRVKEQLKKLGGMEFYDVNFSYIDLEDMSEHYVSVPEQGGGKLIPEGVCNPGQIYTVSHGKSGMISVFRLESQMLPGNGKFERTGIGTDRDAKEASNTAFNFLKANGSRISGSISTTMKDYIINYQDLQGTGMTSTLALPTLIALCSIALGRPTLGSLVVLGEISISGTMIKVDELANALQVCLDSGAKRVLIPATSMVDFATVPPDLMSAFQLIPYQSAEDAVFKALGVE